MRSCALFVAMVFAAAPGSVRADDADAVGASVDGAAPVSVGASVGAGAQGEAMYEAIDVRFDAAWRDVRIGLEARGVWLDHRFRRADWARPIDAIGAIREVEARLGDVALAAGGLAPSHFGVLADGYRAELDDHPRTGVRLRWAPGESCIEPSGRPRCDAGTRAAEVELEIDDALDPALVAGSASWRVAGPWRVELAAAIDPGARITMSNDMSTTLPVASALEVGGARRYVGDRARLDVGGGLVVEPSAHTSGSLVGFADLAADRGGARWTARADVRAGSATDALFGPLYRAERVWLHDGMACDASPTLCGRAAGVSAGATVGVASSIGSLSITARRRMGLAPLVAVSAAAPAWHRVQAAGWVAATGLEPTIDATGMPMRARVAAGAAELHVAWDRRLASTLSLARMLRPDATAEWSLVAWVGASL